MRTGGCARVCACEGLCLIEAAKVFRRERGVELGSMDKHGVERCLSMDRLGRRQQPCRPGKGSISSVIAPLQALLFRLSGC